MLNHAQSSVVYGLLAAARAPDVGEDFGAIAAKFKSHPRASAGVVKVNGFFWLSEAALRDFAGDVVPARAPALYAVQGRGADTLPVTKLRHGKLNLRGIHRQRIARLIRTLSSFWPSAWAPRSSQ
jgi:hypothetical protein